MSELQRLESNFSWSIKNYATFEDGVWRVQTSHPREVHYPETDNEICAGIEDVSYWFDHRNRVLSRVLKSVGLPSALWEIGAGNGYVGSCFSKLGVEIVAVEPGVAGAKKIAERKIGVSIAGFFEDLKLPKESIQAIGCFDVLEHLADPEELVTEIYRVLEPGGIVLVSVPALPCLWSQADDCAGHFRRYTRSSLATLFPPQQFSAVSSDYFMMCLVPAVYLGRTLPYIIGRRLSDREFLATSVRQHRAPSIASRLVKYALGLDEKLQQFLAIPFGSSLYGCYRKQHAQRLS